MAGSPLGVGIDTENVLLQIFNHPHQEGTAGMVHDLVFISNYFAKSSDAEILKANNPPPQSMESDIWDSMLQSAGIRTLRNICIQDHWRENPYLMWGKWGICPVTVCGDICVSEGFFHGDFDKAYTYLDGVKVSLSKVENVRKTRLHPISIASWVEQRVKRGTLNKKFNQKKKKRDDMDVLYALDEASMIESKKVSKSIRMIFLSICRTIYVCILVLLFYFNHLLRFL